LLAQLFFKLAACRTYFRRVDICDADRLMLKVERIAVDDAVVVRRTSAAAKINTRNAFRIFVLEICRLIVNDDRSGAAGIVSTSG